MARLMLSIMFRGDSEMEGRMRDRRGFTLIEIIIVVAIIGIMVAIATSNVMLWLDHSAVVDFRNGLLARHNDARTRAMALNRQHRVEIDLDTETVRLQRGNAGTGSASWPTIGVDVRGSRGAGVDKIAYDNGTTITSGIYSFIFNPGGQVLAQDNSSNIHPITQAKIHLAGDRPSERTQIRLFGFTSKARLENGWH